MASRGLGGAERVLLTLLQNADRQNLELILGIFKNTQQEGDVFCKEAEKTGIPLEVIRCRNPYDISQILDLFRIIRKYHPDIIHTHGYKTNILGFLTSKPLGVPLITTVHGLYKNEAKAIPILGLSLRLLKYFRAIIAVSDNIRLQLENFKVPSRKIITIRNVPPNNDESLPVNQGKFRQEIGMPDDDGKLIGFVGRLETIKGCDLLIRAASRLFSSGLSFRLVIIGDGPEREALTRLAENLGLKEHIYFCGFREDMMNIYQSLDLFVLPSRNEGIPMAMLEAMSQGVPVVATRVGGIPEVITDTVQGLLSPPANPEALADLIIASFKNPEETAKRVLEAKKTVTESHNLEDWIKKYQEVYDMVAQ